jgi:hypothetical protein
VKRDRCRGCGVGLSLGPDAPCPLCGTGPARTNSRRLTSRSGDQREKKATSSHQEAGPARREVVDVASYQSDVQRLREQLRRLRSGAEAV